MLALSVEVAVAMYIGGHTADAHELILKIRPLLQRYTDGDGFKTLLLCENIYGADLRAHSQFREALALDLRILEKFELVFGINHERTLNVRSNIAIDYRQLGMFGEALAADERTLADRTQTLGADDLNTLNSANAVAIDKRGLGIYQESLDIARRVVAAFQRGRRPREHPLAASLPGIRNGAAQGRPSLGRSARKRSRTTALS